MIPGTPSYTMHTSVPTDTCCLDPANGHDDVVPHQEPAFDHQVGHHLCMGVDHNVLQLSDFALSRQDGCADLEVIVCYRHDRFSSTVNPCHDTSNHAYSSATHRNRSALRQRERESIAKLHTRQSLVRHGEHEDLAGIRLDLHLVGRHVDCDDGGSHVGVSLAADGPSQMALPDVAFFRAWTTVCTNDGKPLLYLLQPADAYAAYALTVAMAEYDGPCYLRTVRPDVPLLYNDATTFPLGGHHVLSQRPRPLHRGRWLHGP